MDFNGSFPAAYHPSPATIPFAWEEKPGVPKSFFKFLEHDFTFDVTGELSNDSVRPAEDLFDSGVIKRGSSVSCSSGLVSSTSRRTQSFSTRREWECPWEEQEQEHEQENIRKHPQILVSSYSSLSASSSVKRSRKWRFKDLFLFRSASDGRAMDRDPLKKYLEIFRKNDDNFKNPMELQTHGFGLGSKRKISAHELQYKVNWAVANDMKKKTFLPYKQGILG